MSTFAVTPVATVSAAGHRGAGHSRATIAQEGDTPLALVFAVGNAGERFSAVKVVIKDESGSTVASFALAALSGTQNVIWTPRPGTAAGGYAAYWEGNRLAVEEP
jgi:hypothetical protein